MLGTATTTAGFTGAFRDVRDKSRNTNHLWSNRRIARIIGYLSSPTTGGVSLFENIVGIVFGAYLVAGTFLAGGKWDIYSRPVKQPSKLVRIIYLIFGLLMWAIVIGRLTDVRYRGF